MTDLTIIVPVRNEEGNIEELVRRIDQSLKEAEISYKVIFIDDKSIDKTKDKIIEASVKYPISYFKKQGNVGKAYSILEGAKRSRTQFIAMIDGDLQYPPEALPKMYELALSSGVVVANRRNYKSSWIRKFGSTMNSLIFNKFISGLSCDVQSGLKIFRKEILNYISAKDLSPWTLDLPLLYTAKELGYEIKCVDIDFLKRKEGKSKINFVKASAEIAYGSLKMKFNREKVYTIKPDIRGSMVGAGVIHKKKRYITHTDLPHTHSAIKTFTTWQKAFFIVSLLVLLTGILLNAKLTAIIVVGVLSVIYFTDLLFSFYLLMKSMHFPPEIKVSEEEIDVLKDDELPTYSVLCPLYKEAAVIPDFLKSISELNWPKDKLDVLLLIEEDDKETSEAIDNAGYYSFVRKIVVPNSEPRTKPKACNYGLHFAFGEYVVVYDAEDRPDPLQLKKSYLAFKRLGSKVFCLQSKLNYYNTDTNLLTRLFTAEYSLWFDLILPGLQSIDTTIPLGGTSNHFRRLDLLKIHAWDPFNVTEDADLGVRLFKEGYRTAIVDSLTLEEANSKFGSWLKQRSRWIKGYMQTYLVHMRNPIEFVKNHGIHAFVFQLVMGMRIVFLFINPILWTLTISYFALYKIVGPTIESLYPPIIFYIAGTSAVFGNFIYLYDYMIGAAKRERWSVIKFVFLIPFYWLMTSIAAVIAAYQLFVKPYYWEKTAHGLNRAETKEKKASNRLNFKFSNDIGFAGIAKIKKLTKSKYFSGAFLIGSSMFVNVLNFVYNAYLSRRIGLDDFGLIGLVGSFIYLTSVPLSALSGSVTHRSAYLLGKFDTPIKSFWAKTRKRSIKISLVLAVIWMLLTPVLTHLFKSNTVLPFLIFLPVWIFGFAAAVDNGFINGNLFFMVSGIAGIIEATIKLVLSVFFVETGFHSWVYLAIPASMFISFLITWYFASHIKSNEEQIKDSVPQNFPNRFFAASVVNKLSNIVFLGLDIIVAKLFLSPVDAGRYTLISIAGKIIYFFGSQFTPFIIPLISKHTGSGVKSENTFYKLLAATVFSSLTAFVAIGLLGKYTTPILFGPKILSVTEFLPVYTLAMVFQVLAGSIVLYHQSKNEHTLTYFAFIFSILQVSAMFIFHTSISSIVNVMFFGGVTYLSATLVMHFFYDQIHIIARNVLDLIGLFVPASQLEPDEVNNKLKILVFNWRDTRHVWSGGAEVYIQELAKRWVKKGHEVTLFCGNDTKSPRNEVIDGVNIIRRGGFYTVFIWAFLYYETKFKGHYDLIIDAENGIPFFTPLYAKERIFLLIHHVHQEVFRIKLSPPFSWIGMFLEKDLMPRVYQNTDVITVSPSSKADILEHKLTKKEPHVIYNGVDTNVYKPGRKSINPMVLYLGRLSKQKSLSVFIKSAKKILKKIPSVEFIIAGDGTERKSLIRLTKQMGLENKITFTGKVSQEEKVILYQKAWIFINPSLIEGWGITTIEANACGTPVVASNVAGLRDAVHNPHSGVLVPYGDVDEFAKSAVTLLRNEKVLKQMSVESVDWARKFDWNKSAEDILKIF